jgi:DNA-binding CsgD family transcriptional regulator
VRWIVSLQRSEYGYSVDDEQARREHAYREREKELDGLYQLATLFSQSSGDTQELLRATARIIRASMQFAELASVSISVGEMTAEAGPPAGSSGRTSADHHRAVHVYDDHRQVVIEVTYFQPVPPTHDPPAIDKPERRLVESATSLLGNVVLRMEATVALQQKNIALREILHQIERDKEELLQSVSAGIETLVTPYLHELSRSNDLTDSDRRTVSVLETALHQLINLDPSWSVSAMHDLTPREAEVVGLIRNGLSTKEIAEFLHIALPTVQTHRNMIRKKMGLRGSNTNLTSYLRFARQSTV